MKILFCYVMFIIFKKSTEENALPDIFNSISSTRTTTFSATTESSFINNALPIPVGLSKLYSTEETLTLGCTHRDNNTQVRVEYRRAAGRSNDWNWEEISDPNNFIIRGLQRGVLYEVRMRSQRKRFGRYEVSLPSRPIFARTNPPMVTNLTVVQSSSNWSQVNVSWEKPPIRPFGMEYNGSILTYQIEGLTLQQKATFPSGNKTLLVSSLETKQQSIILNLVVGATYLFEVVTFSGGQDLTKSQIVSYAKTLDIPGPLNLTVTNIRETALVVTWVKRPGVFNITSYIVSWSKTRKGVTNITTTFTNATISNLTPGTLYIFLIKSVQANNLFGKMSKAAPLIARTKPQAPSNLTAIYRTSTEIKIQFNGLGGNVSDVIVTYKTAESERELKKAVNVATNSVTGEGTATLLNLQPAALYIIYVTVFSQAEKQTNNSATFFARTEPLLPSSLKVKSDRGTIYLSWKSPSMHPSSLWHYQIDYYPADARNETKSFCQVKGQAIQKVSLPDVVSGTKYYISVRTVAGETCNQKGSYVTRSRTSRLLSAYTQPYYPIIRFWKQITLNSVKIVWSPPSVKNPRFDYYIIGVKRLRNKKSYVKYEKEEFMKKVNKDQLSYVFQLTQGGYYRVNVTTFVGSTPDGQRSIATPGVNSVQFKTWYRYYDQLIFPRLVWKLTTCGRSGRFGPSQLMCDSAYTNTNLQELIEVKNGIQYWTTPMDGLYRIVAAGAGYEGPGGLGATVSGLFHLKEGAVLQIGVGQRGRSRGIQMTHGGAGGTFVVAANQDSQGINSIDVAKVMLVAGGAGSAGIDMPKSNIANAKLSHNGGNGSDVGIGYGRGGIGDGEMATSGMRGAQGTGGGAGYKGIAEAAVVLNAGDTSSSAVGFDPFVGKYKNLNSTERMQYIPLSGGRYQSGFTYSEGGFGGGGSGYLTGVGGGGGYSGGGAGPIGGYSGGGGSFIKFTGGVQYAEITNDKPGFVTISIVGLQEETPVPLTLYLVIAFLIGILFTLACAGGLYGVSKCTDKCINSTEDKNAQTTERLSNLNIDEVPVQPLVINNPQSIRHPEGEEASFSSESETVAEANNSEPEEDSDTDKRLPVYGWPSTLDRYQDTDLRSDEDSGSLSTGSSVSSMGTGLTENKFDIDSATGKVRYRGRKVSRMNSSFTGFESTDVDTIGGKDAHDDVESLPPPPPTPPRSISPELVSEEQKIDFRQKLSMFHEMAERSRRTGVPSLNKPSFIPSTNL